MTEKEAHSKLKEIGQKSINKFGNYMKPNALKVLEESNISTELLGFYVDYDCHYDSTPFDTIPFATTGGDGCHFCFLTDFGECSNLNEAPIVFISPTDFDETNPQYGNFLYAKNFIDFLRINISICYPELIRFEDLREMNFGKKKEEIQSENSQEELEDIRKIINQLKELYGIQPIEDLNSYYNQLYNSRNTKDYIKTKDNLNIFYKDEEELCNAMLNGEINLESWLENANKKSRTKFYRDLPITYNYYKPEYQNTLKGIVKYLIDDNYLREAKVIEFESTKSQEYEVMNKQYLKIRSESNER